MKSGGKGASPASRTGIGWTIGWEKEVILLRHGLLLILILSLAGCRLHLEPGALYWSEPEKKADDSRYYLEKARGLTRQLERSAGRRSVSKVVVMNLVNDQGEVSSLGEYFSGRVVEAFSEGGGLTVVERGEIRGVLARLDVKPAAIHSREELARLKAALAAEALITGRITDLGTGLDVRLTLTDMATGEMIGAASESLKRTRFALEMLRHPAGSPLRQAS